VLGLSGFVGNGNFDDPVAHLARLCGHFGTEFEAHTLECHFFQRIRPERFIAGRLIRDLLPIQQQDQEIKDFDTEEICEVDVTNAALFPEKLAPEPLAHIKKRLQVHETGTVNDRRLTFFHRLKHFLVVVRVVFKVRVLDDHDISRNAPKRGPDRESLAMVFFEQDNTDIRQSRQFASYNLSRTIIRLVVDDNDLLLDIDGHDAPDELLDSVFFVMYGNYYGKLHHAYRS